MILPMIHTVDSSFFENIVEPDQLASSLGRSVVRENIQHQKSECLVCYVGSFPFKLISFSKMTCAILR